jgi:hypothetical protein
LAPLEEKMKSDETHSLFIEAISGASADVQEIAKRLRHLIRDEYPDVVEVAWPRQKIIGYGVGPKKMSEHFCYIGVHRKHVNLGFYYGADLADPEGLMEGTGKKLRHIKVRDVGEIDRPSIRDLIKVSLDERKIALGMNE